MTGVVIRVYEVFARVSSTWGVGVVVGGEQNA